VAGVEGQVADSLGDLVDRLSITNVKLFMVQERAHEAAHKHTGLDADSVFMLVTLNRQRNQLMTRIDMALDGAVKSGAAAVDARVKLD